MRKIVSTLFTTLDNVVESPHEWHGAYFDDAMGEAVGTIMRTQTAYLMGRVLYDQWAAYWPSNDTDAFAEFINTIPKYVLTHRPLDGPDWANTSAIGADPVAEITALKQDGDGDIGMSGSPTTVRWLLAHGLLDVLELIVDPIVVGTGARLFEGAGRTELTLLDSSALPKGALHLRYGVEPQGHQS